MIRGKWQVAEGLRGGRWCRAGDFQYWLYKLRREREARTGRAASVPEVRLIPVTVKARAVLPALIEIRVAGVRLRVPLGADVEYVGRLATVLRDGRPC